jgi:hypothetical protein
VSGLQGKMAGVGGSALSALGGAKASAEGLVSGLQGKMAGSALGKLTGSAGSILGGKAAAGLSGLAGKFGGGFGSKLAAPAGRGMLGAMAGMFGSSSRGSSSSSSSSSSSFGGFMSGVGGFMGGAAGGATAKMASIKSDEDPSAHAEAAMGLGLPVAGSEAGDENSGYEALSALVHDPADSAYAPVDERGGHPQFGTDPQSLSYRTQRVKESFKQGGAQAPGSSDHGDPATLDYANNAELPATKFKVAPDEKFSMAFRLDKMTGFFRTYQHVMDAMQDICEGMMPMEVGQYCRPLYVRASKITMWAIHGYQPDEICVKSYLCKDKFFDAE